MVISHKTLVIGLSIFLSISFGSGILSAQTTPKKTITITTLQFLPISDANTANGGFIGELFTEIFKYSGIGVKIEIHPWARSFELSKAGISVAGIFPSIYSDERTKWFYFSDTVLTSSYVLVTRKETGIRTYSSIYEFKDKTIGILRGGVTGSIIDGNEFKKEEGVDFEMNLRKLINGRYDLITGEYMSIMNGIKKVAPEKQDSFVVILPPVSSVDFHLMISKNATDAQAILSACNFGIAEIKKNGILDSLIRKYGVSPPVIPTVSQ